MISDDETSTDELSDKDYQPKTNSAKSALRRRTSHGNMPTPDHSSMQKNRSTQKPGAYSFDVDDIFLSAQTFERGSQWKL
jgi:hypothetical protein